jgi:hypothetical protein
LARAATDGSAAATVALTETLGLQSVWAAEHIAVPDSFGSRYPYSTPGKTPFAGSRIDMPDPFI